MGLGPAQLGIVESAQQGAQHGERLVGAHGAGKGVVLYGIGGAEVLLAGDTVAGTQHEVRQVALQPLLIVGIPASAHRPEGYEVVLGIARRGFTAEVEVGRVAVVVAIGELPDEAYRA